MPKFTVKCYVTTYQEWYDIEATTKEEAISKVMLSEDPSDYEDSLEDHRYDAEREEQEEETA